jgi:hypothetical protein
VTGNEIYVLRRGAARFEKREMNMSGRHGATVAMLVAAPDGSVWNVHPSFGVSPVADARGGAQPPGTLAYADTGMYNLIWPRDHPAVVLVLPERSGWSVLWSRLLRRNFVPL